MKKIIILSFVVLAFFTNSNNVLAESNSSYRALKPAAVRLDKLLSPLASNSGESQKRMVPNASNLKQRALSEIERQLSILSELLSKIDSLTHITDTEKDTLKTQIQNEITNLQTLKARIEAIEDAVTLRSEIKSVLTSHKKFTFFSPQIRLLIAAEVMDAIANRMLETVKKIEDRMTTTPSTNNATITPILENMKAKLNNAKAQSNAIIAAVSPLKSADFPANKTTLQSAQAKLKTGMSDIRSAIKDLKDILKILQDKNTEETATKSTEM